MPNSNAAKENDTADRVSVDDMAATHEEELLKFKFERILRQRRDVANLQAKTAAGEKQLAEMWEAFKKDLRAKPQAEELVDTYGG